MVEDIYSKTGETVNANTLRRFFGLVKADYPASSSTLTILSKYCGFNSIDEVEHVSLRNNNEGDINKEEVLRYMVSLFKNTLVPVNEERAFYPIVEQTIVFLERNPSLIDKFQREVAKTSAGRYYYYEKIPNIDKMEGYFGDGLRHYLRSKASEEGKIFGHSMQIFRYWLTQNNEQLIHHAEMIPKSVIPTTLPGHIVGRFVAARLYHAHARNDSTDRILSDARSYHAAIRASRGFLPTTFPDFELIVCEALLLTGNYDEGIEYIWHGKNFLSESARAGQDKNSPFDIWENFVNSRKDNGQKKKKEFIEVPESPYSFSKKFNSIVKLLSAKNLKTSQRQQLAELIKVTGYRRLASLPTS
jgi:hypothetical protein